MREERLRGDVSPSQTSVLTFSAPALTSVGRPPAPRRHTNGLSKSNSKEAATKFSSMVEDRLC